MTIILEEHSLNFQATVSWDMMHQKPVGNKSLDSEWHVDTCFSQQNNSAIVIIFNRIGLHTVG